MNKKQAERYGRLVLELSTYGLDKREIDTLLRAEKCLHRWAEGACNGEIQRDESTNKPYRWFGRTMENRYPIADKESGALARIVKICDAHGLAYYHQGDPRGCNLYVIRPGDIRDGQKVESCYNQGLAICID